MLPVLLTVLAVGADDAPKTPPHILTASVKDDKLVSRRVYKEHVPVTTLKREKQGDKEVDVPYTTYQTVTRTADVAYDLKKATISTAGGKKLDVDALKKRLAKPTPVVVSADGKAVDESYLKLFDKDVIVIVLPAPKDEAPKVEPAPPVEIKPPPPPKKDER